MVYRRKLLATLGAISGTVALAGCSGSGEPDEEPEAESEPEPNSEQGDEEEAEAETELLADISVDNINLTYGFSAGLRARITLTNQAEEGTGSQSVYTQIEAFDGNSSIGTDSTWSDITAGFSETADLTVDIGSLSDNDIDDVTEFVISGRLRNEELGEIARLTGDELRDRVDN